MKKSELHQIIKEEISKVLNETNNLVLKIIKAFEAGASYVYVEGYFDKTEVKQAAQNYATQEYTDENKS